MLYQYPSTETDYNTLNYFKQFGISLENMLNRDSNLRFI